MGVQINTERANAALLSWVPAQDSRRNPPSGYVLERQEVGTGSQEWLQCLTTDSATSVEILGDSVPCEADYRFRICSVNKYGKSNNVEFPRAVHLGKFRKAMATGVNKLPCYRYCLLNYVHTFFQCRLQEYKLLYRMHWYQRDRTPSSLLNSLHPLLVHGS